MSVPASRPAVASAVPVAGSAVVSFTIVVAAGAPAVVTAIVVADLHVIGAQHAAIPASPGRNRRPDGIVKEALVAVNPWLK